MTYETYKSKCVFDLTQQVNSVKEACKNLQLKCEVHGLEKKNGFWNVLVCRERFSK